METVGDEDDLPPPAPSYSPPPLPPNWKHARDPRGMTYYYNCITKQTQWTTPVSDGTDPGAAEPMKLMPAVPETSQPDGARVKITSSVQPRPAVENVPVLLIINSSVPNSSMMPTPGMHASSKTAPAPLASIRNTSFVQPKPTVNLAQVMPVSSKTTPAPVALIRNTSFVKPKPAVNLVKALPVSSKGAPAPADSIRNTSFVQPKPTVNLVKALPVSSKGAPAPAASIRNTSLLQPKPAMKLVHATPVSTKTTPAPVASIRNTSFVQPKHTVKLAQAIPVPSKTTSPPAASIRNTSIVQPKPTVMLTTSVSSKPDQGTIAKTVIPNGSKNTSDVSVLQPPVKVIPVLSVLSPAGETKHTDIVSLPDKPGNWTPRGGVSSTSNGETKSSSALTPLIPVSASPGADGICSSMRASDSAGRLVGVVAGIPVYRNSVSPLLDSDSELSSELDESIVENFVGSKEVVKRSAMKQCNSKVVTSTLSKSQPPSAEVTNDKYLNLIVDHLCYCRPITSRPTTVVWPTSVFEGSKFSAAKSTPSKSLRTNTELKENATETLFDVTQVNSVCAFDGGSSEIEAQVNLARSVISPVTSDYVDPGLQVDDDMPSLPGSGDEVASDRPGEATPGLQMVDAEQPGQSLVTDSLTPSSTLTETAWYPASFHQMLTETNNLVPVQSISVEPRPQSSVQYEKFGRLAKWSCDIDCLIQLHARNPILKQTSEASAPAASDSRQPDVEPKRIQTGEKTYKCCYCEKAYVHKSTLERHKKLIHRNEKPSECSVHGGFILESGSKQPGERSNECARREKTLSVNKGEKVFKCKLCEEAFTQKEDLLVHTCKLAHSGEQTFRCSQCKQTFSDKKKLKWHEVSCRRKCLACGKTFRDWHLLRKHELHHERHGDKCFKCADCEKSFQKGFRLLKHNNATKTKCTICQESVCHGYLAKHMATHGEKPFQCSLCASVFKERNQLVRHQLVHTENKLACSLCHKHFKDKYGLREHERNHTRGRQHKCGHCDKAFFYKHHLENHVAFKHSGENIFKCSVCAKVFASKNGLTQHRLIHSSDTVYSCFYCGLQFVSRVKLDIHEGTHRGKGSWKCRWCGKAYKSQKGLKWHAHKSPGDGHLKCVHCQKVFRSHCNMNAHVRIRAEGKHIKCKYCDETSRSRCDFNAHVPLHKDEKPFKCSHCPKAFRLKEVFTQHVRIHTGEKPFECTHCGKTFRTSSTLRSHLLRHTGDKRHLCSFCGRRFITTATLKVHLRTHTGERPYECTRCQKRFKRKEHLDRHFRFHSGEKPYVCSFCGKGFSQSNNCHAHERNHTGQKPFKCFQCPKTYHSKYALTIHERVHTGEEPFLCSTCGKRFHSEALCRAHRLLHLKGKSFGCAHCEKVFISKSDLAKHLRKEHSETGIKP